MKKNTLIQLAVFIENRTGRLAEICKTLGDKGINIFGFSIADTEDYGIFRLICKRYQMAHQILKEAGFTVRENEVICVKVPHEPGGLAAGEVARLAGVPQNTMSTHLATLANCGLVHGTRHSRSIIYRASLKHFRALLTYMLKNCCGGKTGQCEPLLAEINRNSASMANQKERRRA